MTYDKIKAPDTDGFLTPLGPVPGPGLQRVPLDLRVCATLDGCSRVVACGYQGAFAGLTSVGRKGEDLGRQVAADEYRLQRARLAASRHHDCLGAPGLVGVLDFDGRIGYLSRYGGTHLDDCHLERGRVGWPHTFDQLPARAKRPQTVLHTVHPRRHPQRVTARPTGHGARRGCTAPSRSARSSRWPARSGESRRVRVAGPRGRWGAWVHVPAAG